MKNILFLIKNDFDHIRHNYLAWVVIIGLIVVPALYAWFSTYAFWDPYNNTGNLTIAVANSDEGIRGNIVPLDVNIGEKVVAALRENDDIHWVFVDERTAVNGVKAGDYYAAMVIPADFSRQMLSIFGSDPEKAEIDYYINEKENAIAAKVSDQGAATVEKQIDEVFAKTVAKIGIETMENLGRYFDESDLDAAGEAFGAELKTLGDELTTAADTVAAVRDMNLALTSLLGTVTPLLKETGDTTLSQLETLSQEGKKAQKLSDGVTAVTTRTEQAFNATEKAFEDLDQRLSDTLTATDSDAKDIAAALTAAADEVQAVIDRYEGYQKTVTSLASALPAGDTAIATALGNLNADISAVLQRQKHLRTELNDAATELTTTSADIGRYQKELSAAIDGANKEVATAADTFQKEVRPQWDDLKTMLDRTGDAAAKIVKDLNADVTAANDVATDATKSLNDTNNSLNDTEKLLRAAAEKINKLSGDFLADGGELKTLLAEFGDDGERAGEIFAAAVTVEKNEVYPIENFASGMAPFYTSLALYVGGLIMVAIMKVSISSGAYRELKDVKDYQLYFGRGFIFVAIGIAQSLLVAAGMLFFVGIHCVQPLLFIATAVAISFIFVTFLYTLTVSFGNIGKAIAVIIMVLQVGGSGGTIPIQLTPKFFQNIYPLLPFTHSMTALRECIGGLYANTLPLSLAKLSLYLLFSLALGLLLRKPLMKLNQKFIEKVESTKVM